VEYKSLFDSCWIIHSPTLCFIFESCYAEGN
jgi:hypothetical protein